MTDVVQYLLQVYVALRDLQVNSELCVACRTNAEDQNSTTVLSVWKYYPTYLHTHSLLPAVENSQMFVINVPVPAPYLQENQMWLWFYTILFCAFTQQCWQMHCVFKLSIRSFVSSFIRTNIVILSVPPYLITPWTILLKLTGNIY